MGHCPTQQSDLEPFLFSFFGIGNKKVQATPTITEGRWTAFQEKQKRMHYSLVLSPWGSALPYTHATTTQKCVILSCNVKNYT